MARDGQQRPGAAPTAHPEMMHGGLTIERYGEISAYLRRFPRSARSEVLARLAIPDVDWEAAVGGWTDALAEESADGGEALSNRFCRAFAGTEARLEREQPAIASLGALPSDGRGSTPEPADHSPAPAVTTRPTAQPAPPASSPWSRPPVDVATPSAPVLAAGLPAAGPHVAPALPMVPVGMRHFTSLRETVEASAATSHGPALPFQIRVREAAPESDERVAASTERAGEVMPVTGSARPVGGATADVSSAVASALGQRDPLPFKAATAHPPLPVDPRTGRAPAPAQHALLGGAIRPAPSATAESTLRGEASGAVRGLASPPDRTAHVVTLSLEQHASMCAEIAVAPDRAAEIIARHGLTEATRAQVDEHWRARIAEDAWTGEAWRRAYVRYRDWLLGLRS